MKKVDQTRTGMPSGNCMEACIASLLEVPLSDVPDLGDKKDSDWEWCQIVLTNWLVTQGFWWVDFSIGDEKYADFFKKHRIPDNAWVVLCGDNPDGIAHAVVGQKISGELLMIHDPNPSRRGIVKIDSIMVLIPIDPVLAKNVSENREWSLAT